MNYMFRFIFLFFIVGMHAQQNTFIEEQDYTKDDTEYKNITFKKGKPVFVVIDLYSNLDPYSASITKRELEELKRNFKKVNANFHLVTLKGVLLFDNNYNDRYDYRDNEEQVKKVLFWDGNEKSIIHEYDQLIESSEFFASILKTKVKSSYVEKFKSTKDSLANKIEWNPDQNSKALSKKYIEDLILKETYFLEEWSSFFNTDFSGIKKITVSTNTKKGMKPFKILTFNELGNLTNIDVKNEDYGQPISKHSFEYKDDILSKITYTYAMDDEEQGSQEFFFYYNDGKLISTYEDYCEFYELSNNTLTYDSYYYYDDTFEIPVKRLKYINNNTLSLTRNNTSHGWDFIKKKESKYLVEKHFTSTYSKEFYKPMGVEFISLKKVTDLNYQILEKDKIKTEVFYLNKNLIKKVLIDQSDYDVYQDESSEHRILDFKYEYFK